MSQLVREDLKGSLDIKGKLPNSVASCQTQVVGALAIQPDIDIFMF